MLKKDTFLENLLRSFELDEGRLLLLGFSGGPDSLALAHLLKHSEFPLALAHLDHALRPESPAEAERAAALAADWGLDFYSRREDVAAKAEDEGLSLEEAAREARYRYLFALAGELDAQAVLVAHHADDQVETVLMHFLRGAGGAGLSGMQPRQIPNPWSQRIPLLRPLLDFWRTDILAYCEQHGLDPVFDPSNEDQSLFRNRLRHDLLPYLEQYNPQAKQAIHRSADVLAADEALLERLASAAWEDCLAAQGEGYVALYRQKLPALPLALQRRILRLAFTELRPEDRDIGFDHLEQALNVFNAEAPPDSQDWLAGLYILVESGIVFLADRQAQLPQPWPQLPAGESFPIELPAEIDLLGGWRFQALLTAPDIVAAESNVNAFSASLDAQGLLDTLTLRTRQPGDRFQPLGMARGSMKLSDFMINEKMPERARDDWPLLCRGDEVLWVPGYRIAHSCRLQEDSRQALQLSLTKLA